MRLYFSIVLISLAAYALLFSPQDQRLIRACQETSQNPQECRLSVLGR